MDGRILINPVQNNPITNEAVPYAEPVNPISPSKEIGESEKLDGSKECQTCKNRKYQDGSNEMVSFKSSAHISPTAAGSMVRAHEMEHVNNAYAKATKGNGKVLQASVTLKTAICPECGRAYVSGGVTNTKIKYSNEDQPYQKQLKAMLEDAGKGDNFDVNS
ncbi:MAG: hypothetical protein MJ126_08650 [Lachnospiraceae bacterium]|nr:hypothetical protein [Lachnospiraceae bacterium]